MWHCVVGSVVVGDRQYHSDFVINVERSNINDFYSLTQKVKAPQSFKTSPTVTL